MEELHSAALTACAADSLHLRLRMMKVRRVYSAQHPLAGIPNQGQRPAPSLNLCHLHVDGFQSQPQATHRVHIGDMDIFR
jgi:hypothetical protein